MWNVKMGELVLEKQRERKERGRQKGHALKMKYY